MKKTNHPDYVSSIFIYKSDGEVSRSKSKLKLYQLETKMGNV